jgi:hypothetical protein
MEAFKPLRGMAVAACAAMSLLLPAASCAWAETAIKLCIPETASKTVVVPNAKGECVNTKTVKYNKVQLPGSGELETLNKILPHVKYVESGVGGKPTIQFSGVNVQVVSGVGKTNAAVNGEGNLVIGYDENPGTETGSHDLILGEEQTFTSYGGIVGGLANSVTGPNASVIGGSLNSADGEGASIDSGQHNVASSRYASISGGFGNLATGSYAALSGGVGNTASGSYASVGGGASNEASTEAWIGGGYKNTTSGRLSAVFGGKEQTAKTEYQAIP